MKKLLLETSFSKIYMIGMLLITFLILGGYFSYAMFTVSKEKGNAISIVTGNLTYKLEVDGIEDNKLVVPANSSKDFVVTLSNPNNRIARFNFYYLGTIATGITAGYVIESGVNTPPVATGINMEANGTSGSSNTYLIRVTNTTSSNITIDLGVSVGLDYNDLTLPSNGHLFTEYEGVELATLLKMDSANNIDTTDPEQAFITGETPNNYIWYSGKLWRAVSIDPSDNSVKLITDWVISSVAYDDNIAAFKGSHMEMWLNDTSVDGFLGNLRDPENFIKMDSVWNVTMTTSTSKPPKTTLVTDPVGVLNIYEFVMTNKETLGSNSYLINGLAFGLGPYNETRINSVSSTGEIGTTGLGQIGGATRPVINLKVGIKAVDGTGTESDPYRLEGDNDTSLNGTLLNTRYSGEYIRFGEGDNNLYRIVSHETPGLTKITSAEYLKENNNYKIIGFGSTNLFSSTNTIGTFLNNDYLNPANNYLTSEQVDMIEDNTTWYLGGIDSGYNYRFTKYKDINMTSFATSTEAKVGLLRNSELMQISDVLKGPNDSMRVYSWLLTPRINTNRILTTNSDGFTSNLSINNNLYIKPALNLKENIIITGGKGTKEDPFIIELA